MFLNYLTTFLRILTRQKIYSAINVFGLAIGLAVDHPFGIKAINPVGILMKFIETQFIKKVHQSRHWKSGE